LIRGSGLSETMSKYLVDRIASTPNIMLMPTTELTGLFGDEEHGLARVEWKVRGSESTFSEAIRHVFLFVGADPATEWLVDTRVELDQSGFVLTGERAGVSRGALESSQSGVFVVGDVRSGSVKRVGAAIGEGAQVVAALHEYLAKWASKNVA
jgi:thioredoxin reductase (NADPH)